MGFKAKGQGGTRTYGEAMEMILLEEGVGWRVVKVLHPRPIAGEIRGHEVERASEPSIRCAFRPPGRGE